MLLGVAVLTFAFGLLWLKVKSDPFERFTSIVLRSPVTAVGVSLGLLPGYRFRHWLFTPYSPVWLERVFPLVALLLALSLITRIFQAFFHGAAPWKKLPAYGGQGFGGYPSKDRDRSGKDLPATREQENDWIVLVVFSLLFAAFKVSPYVNFNLLPGLDPS
jgi:hypothetical protein